MKPIIVENTELQFVLVGSMNNQDGIIIQSSIATADFIGVAYILYSKEPNNEDIRVDLMNLSIKHIWVDFPGKDKNYRGRRLLFCWKGPGIRLGRLPQFLLEDFRKENINLNNVVNLYLERFLENTYLIIKDRTQKNTPLANAIEEQQVTQIAWHISPVILVCQILENYQR